jgi:hypothetical protein
MNFKVVEKEMRKYRKEPIKAAAQRNRKAWKIFFISQPYKQKIDIGTEKKSVVAKIENFKIRPHTPSQKW